MERNSLKHLRVDHVGSLLRPASLIEAFLAFGRREIGLAELESAQDQAIRDVVAKQEAIGFPSLATASIGG
jgi:5-methyltetrahydropteroyltriglutamate--homocysteine methyltransferase